MLLPTVIPDIGISLKELDLCHKLAKLSDICDQGYVVKGLCNTPEALFKQIHITSFLTGAQTRPLLREAWKGPGVYHVMFCTGASQEQDIFKQDDTWLEVTYEPC